MSHEIYKDKFISVRKPAWHRIGLHFLEPIPPSEAVALAGFEEPNLVPLLLPNGQPSGYAGVLSPEGKLFGVVSKRWELIRLEDILPILDEISQEIPLSATGQLRHGKYVFFTFEHRGEIVGEEYLKHLVIFHSYEPGKSWKVLYSPTRVVCMNTLLMAERDSIFEISVKHFQGATEKARGATLLAMARAKQSEIDAKLEALARVGDFDAQVDALLNYVYALPPEPKPVEDPEEAQKRQEAYERRLEYVQHAREAFSEAYARFNDEFPRLARTAYAGLQALVETADWRVAKNRTPKDYKRLDEARVVGYRAQEKILGWRFMTRFLR